MAQRLFGEFWLSGEDVGLRPVALAVTRQGMIVNPTAHTSCQTLSGPLTSAPWRGLLPVDPSRSARRSKKPGPSDHTLVNQLNSCGALMQPTFADSPLIGTLGVVQGNDCTLCQ